MTATDAPTLDLGQVAVLAEAHTPATGTLTVDVASIDELAPQAGAAGWMIEHEGGIVVFAPIGTPSPEFVDGLVQHIAGQLGLTASDADAATLPAPTAASAVGMRTDDGTGVAAYLAPVSSVAPPAAADPISSVAGEPSNGLITLGMLREVPLEVSAELGRARMSVSEILQLNVGSLVELDRTAGSPVDVVVNGSMIARGEVVVIDDEYGVRITEILARVGDSL
ncbi:MAG: flagellar motor switch protein FliN [Actinomycetota bacterium]